MLKIDKGFAVLIKLPIPPGICICFPIFDLSFRLPRVAVRQADSGII